MTGLIAHLLRREWRGVFRDEFQNITPGQMRTIRALLRKPGRVVIAGTPPRRHGKSWFARCFAEAPK